MQYSIYDFFGNVGVLLIIVAYLLLQLEKMSSKSLYFSLYNAAGALLIIISLFARFNLSAFIIEAFWLLISLVGIIRVLFKRRSNV